MTDYKVRDRRTGAVITMRGDGPPPTEAEIEAAFNAQPSAEKPAAKEEGLSSLLPTVGGAIGGIAGGPLGAAAGGAAGQGFRSLANNIGELGGIVGDIERTGEPMAALKGFAEGATGGALDAGVQGGIQGALGAAGSAVMKAPGAVVTGLRMMGVPIPNFVGTGLQLLKGGKAMLPKGAVPAAAEAVEQSVPKAATGRLVTGRGVRSAEQEMADAIAEVRATPSTPRITTPPEPNLPAGFTPRSTVPKAAPKPTPTAAPKPTSDLGPRNYFLKSDAAPSAAPKGGPVGIDDLPESLKAFAKPGTFAPRTIGGSELAAKAGPELSKAGVSPAEVMRDIQSRTDLTADAKTKLLNALMKLAEVQ